MTDTQERLLRTSLTVDEFGKIFGLHPWLLHQFLYISTSQTFFRSSTPKCTDPVYQFQYHNNAMSRYDISRAILDAELTLLDYLGYYPGNGWITEEEHDITPNLCDGTIWRSLPCSLQGIAYLLRADYGNIKSFGVETLTSQAVDEPVTREKSIAGMLPAGFLDRFTLTVGVPDDTEECDVAIFHAASNLGNLDQASWEIRPVNIVIDSSGGAGAWAATVTGPAYLLVRPELMITPLAEALQADVASNYVEEVDVFIRGINTDLAGTMFWDSACTVTTQFSCHDMFNAEYGYFTPYPVVTVEGETEISYPSVCAQYGTTSSRLRINYLSGCDLDGTCEVNEKCKLAVAYLAAANLQCLPCGCACENNEERLGKYGRPPMYHKNNKITFTQARKMGACPFGDSYGAIKAWEIAQRIKLKKPTLMRG